MAILDLITKEDLLQFKMELLEEMRQIQKQNGDTVGSKKWMKGIDVRRMLSISSGTLQNLRINGTIQYSKVGGSMFYKLEDIETMLGEKNKG
ncbi:helix-turn-helix domain-containing protein [Pedobacter mucosus]|uniref:helix-turn-helix domain-containing protein n=1 Tax=Pedobacter mucosus TaxID=2895286 RepID=UPI001EE4846E|nr:helix-turn-helix domain-containing protein [Pedobacter mucosus]UKT63966.1 helix-turn-helix domain-containing protein [Pedobacter mucosus]